MKTTFNLSKFNKTAFYDDSRGLMQKQTRAYQNCYKAKMDSGMSAHKASEACLEEYQSSGTNDWGMKYANVSGKAKK